ncbi:MAG: winged helix-turn-helix domain-containing protein [Thermoanaerobaculia bacterium]|nr:winged helix-turn-helix domain-containing protein [Thermoanaerobaculia bacterium]
MRAKWANVWKVWGHALDEQRQNGGVIEIFRFGDFQLDNRAFELRRGSVVIPVEPLVMDLLIQLLEHPGEVLSRDRLVDSVWEGRIVSESTISTAIKSARRALGDTGRDQKYIRTLRGRGIQFAVPVATASTTPVGERPPRSDVALGPALYVRPFETMGDEGLDHLARALRTRTASILARIPLLSIASSFPEADRMTDPFELRSRFAITHVLEVRLQQAGTLLTADAALTETLSGIQIWAQQFGTTIGIGDQGTLLQKMIRRLEPRLMQAMAAELKTDGGAPSARTLLMQAIVLLALKGWHRTTFVEATEMIERAIALDPDLALAHAHLALLMALGHRFGLLQEDDTTVPAVIAAVDRTLALENQDSTILGLVGCALADVGQVDRALPILQKAIRVNPENGHAKTALGAAFLVRHDYATAIRYLSEGIACSPGDSRCAVWGAALALALLAQRELDDALEAAENACQEDDRLYLPRLSLAAGPDAGSKRLSQDGDDLSAVQIRLGAHAFPQREGGVDLITACEMNRGQGQPRQVQPVVFLARVFGVWSMAETMTKRGAGT